jgi:hypothetical protein
VGCRTVKLLSTLSKLEKLQSRSERFMPINSLAPLAIVGSLIFSLSSVVVQPRAREIERPSGSSLTSEASRMATHL